MQPMMARKRMKGRSAFSTYINASVWDSKKDEWHRDLDFRGAPIIDFGGFGVILPEWIQACLGVSWKEREKSPQGRVRTVLISERSQETAPNPNTSSQRVLEARAELLAVGLNLEQAQEKKHPPG